ncbi:hypothetical protein B0H10DRAFT_2311807 [Mycena sp. CBHHK59/15]|nr:hypothetical protein B0H10DRAFT_2311807 [Mycena sp. CBHHK59/15]
MLRESGAKDVPSFDRLRQVQQEIRAEYGIPSIPCKSPLGNVFFINDLDDNCSGGLSLKKDWANPAVRAQMHVYPEILDDGVNMDLDVLSPMYDAGTEPLLLNELARLKNGDFVVPVRWLMYRGKVHADAFVVSVNQVTRNLFPNGAVRNYVLSVNFAQGFPAETTNSGHLACMPNPKREIAGGDPLYVTLVDFFGDDVSGNRSKSWNKHLNAYMTNRTLPRKLLQQEFHVHFVSTSLHDRWLSNVSLIVQHVRDRDTHSNPVRVQDENGRPHDSVFIATVHRRQPHAEQQVLPQMPSWEPRTKEHTLTELKKQVELACGGVSKRVQELQTQTGNSARAAEMRRQDPDASEAAIKSELIQWMRDNEEKLYSPFLTLKGFDPAVDTPVELLHTILLGAVKYLWHISHTPWSAEKKKTYSIRLQATGTNGLSIHAIRANYIMQYAGSLIGQQFKTIIQTAVFHLHDLVTEDQFTAWKAVGELSALLWVPEIRDLSRYRSFNAVFRYCSIYSNHLAPSRDIAIQFGRQETVKHQLTGGRWMSKSTGDWHAAGPGVRHFIEKHPILQRLVGWTPEKQLKHGTCYLPRKDQ